MTTRALSKDWEMGIPTISKNYRDIDRTIFCSEFRMILPVKYVFVARLSGIKIIWAKKMRFYTNISGDENGHDYTAHREAINGENG